MPSTPADERTVLRAVSDVPDPELPPVTVGMLGMIHDLHVDGEVVTVELLPTFSGCPATEMIERDVVAAASEVEGVAEVRVRFRFDPPWTPDRISEEGRRALRSFGIAPPGGPIAGAVRPGGRATLPVAVAAPPVEHRPCPYCGSDDTERESAFGPTPCRDLRFCASCRQPFEAFKTLGTSS